MLTRRTKIPGIGNPKTEREGEREFKGNRKFTRTTDARRLPGTTRAPIMKTFDGKLRCMHIYALTN